MSTVKPSGSVKHSDNGDCTDHLNRNFFLKDPNLVWVSDITYLNAGGKWYHLCIIMDLFSRKVISWKLSAKANAELVMETFRKAYEKRGAPCGLMFHSDRGSQYTSFSFRQLPDSLNVVQSFSKKGCPFDNACCECFFKYLKKEETNRRIYHSFKELQLSVFEYIDGYYNAKRPHGGSAAHTKRSRNLISRAEPIACSLGFFCKFVSTYLTMIQKRFAFPNTESTCYLQLLLLHHR